VVSLSEKYEPRYSGLRRPRYRIKNAKLAYISLITEAYGPRQLSQKTRLKLNIETYQLSSLWVWRIGGTLKKLSLYGHPYSSLDQLSTDCITYPYLQQALLRKAGLALVFVYPSTRIASRATPGALTPLRMQRRAEFMRNMSICRRMEFLQVPWLCGRWRFCVHWRLYLAQNDRTNRENW
jgi:hypothetical protein